MLEAGMEPIPGYRLKQPIGKGGSGEVWEAIDANEHAVALKFVYCRNQSSMVLANEVRVLLRLRDLQHPNIIQFEEVVATSNYLVLRMELAEGSLHDLQEVYFHDMQSPIPADYLLDMLEQAADALDFLASQPAPSTWGAGAGMGMQHCDVKPSNLLLLGDTLKVADFGLCMSSLSRTQGSRFIGTPPYAAPELYRGRVTAQTDQYGLAVTFCQLATRGRVFVDNLDESLYRPIMPLDPNKTRDNEHPVLARALDPDWTNRYENCRQFIDALRKAVRQPRKVALRKNLSDTQRVSVVG